MRSFLLRVTAPHFVAGAVWENGNCVKAAPIIRWMIGKTGSQVKQYLDKKRWKYEWL